MTVYIRTDSNYKVGGGHLSRMLILAKELKLKRKKVIFLIKDTDQNGLRSIKKNFNVIQIPYRFNIKQEIKFLNNIFKEYKISLIKDLYTIGNRWEKFFYELNNIKLIVIDDYTTVKHTCDFLINYSIYKKKPYTKFINKECTILGGNKYILIEPSFKFFKKAKKNKNIFLFFGSSDKLNLTTKYIKLLSDKSFSQYHKFVITTSKNKNLLKIKKLIDSFDFCSTYELIVDTNNIAKYLSNSFFALTSGGTISWEKIYYKVPSISVVTSDDQFYMTKTLAKKKKIYPIYDPTRLINKLKLIQLFNDVDKKFVFSSNFIDLKGAKRIYNAIN